MQHLFSAWNEVTAHIKDQPVMLFLDYDGTLTPIVQHPSLAKLSKAGKKTLEDFISKTEIKTAIVSGRSLEDLKKQIDIQGVIYAGNHGFEFEGPKIHHIHPEAFALKEELTKIEQEISRALKHLEGLFVENKGLTLSIHYRELAPHKFQEAQSLLMEVIHSRIEKREIVMTAGKKVWEIRPPVPWNKGTMIMWLLARMMAQTAETVLPIYIGDDQTDEDAFEAIKGKGYGIKVTEDGREKSYADYFLRSFEEVFMFLDRLKDLKSKTDSVR